MSIFPVLPVLPLTLEATAFNREQLIHPEAPQAALAGRSNVGKSSLINALAGRKSLAKTSAVPGKTRSVNYYRLGREMHFLVDLPGYGYARCSQSERLGWAKLLNFYLRNTPGLQALFLLLDARLPPQASDLEMGAFARSLKLPFIPVLTKTDQCAKRELARTLQAWKSLTQGQELLRASARDGTGLDLLRRNISALLCGQTPTPPADQN
ncbi:MAG: ribosome biogenesis GTP-binding protein YihA/YsxC [Deltaproteobacteria bacterium]|jgi:GTP-binding protein|nr:ribosome biogenesis GTP-binding protein YihA/YsxC [Deltaproteobacteria bacterium]